MLRIDPFTPPPTRVPKSSLKVGDVYHNSVNRYLVLPELCVNLRETGQKGIVKLDENNNLSGNTFPISSDGFNEVTYLGSFVNGQFKPLDNDPTIGVNDANFPLNAVFNYDGRTWCRGLDVCLGISHSLAQNCPVFSREFIVFRGNDLTGRYNGFRYWKIKQSDIIGVLAK